MRTRWILAAGAAACTLIAASTAAAQFRYSFKQTPSDAEQAAAWPAEAKAAGAGGSAVAVCEAARSGKLSQCHIVSEEPTGKGFGAALLSLAPLYQLRLTKPQCADAFHQTVIAAEWPLLDKKPERIRTVGDQDYLVYYPKHALQQRMWGATLVDCRTNPDASLQCDLLYEAPKGEGFGQVALMVAGKMKYRQGERDGKPVSSAVTLPLNFTPKAEYAVDSNCSTR